MIKWLKRLFNNEYKQKYLELCQEHLRTLQQHKSEEKSFILGNWNPDRYITIQKFTHGEREYIRKISTVQEMPEMQFMIFDMKQKYIDMMVEGDIGGNLQVEKAFYILKGISMVERNLNEYKAQWNQIVNVESQHVDKEI
jgi:hypothetical protein